MSARLLEHPGTPEAPSSRARLRRSQARVGAARNAAQRAAQAAERGRAALGRARDALAAYAGLNATIAEHKAQMLRDGATGGELPQRLADLRRRQAVAQQDADDAERAAELLAADEATAQAALVEAEAELRAAADVALQAEAVALIARMREHERTAAADRVLLASFMTLRTLDDPPVSWAIQGATMESLHGHLLDVAASARVPAGEPAWQALKSRLLVDADAALSSDG